MSVTIRPRLRTPTLPRLLRAPGEPITLAAHVGHYGRLPALRGEGAALIAAVEASGLRGRGGAGFPTHLKLRAVASARSPIVVANGVEGEPPSHKDKLLMRANPHLVLDGAEAAAAAVGARHVVIAVSRRAAGAHDSMAAAIAERSRAGARERIELAVLPDRFVAGEETALVQWLNGGPAKPTFAPPRPYEKGVRGRPTLVQNVETLANLALIARHGPAWFRELGSEAEPGSMLATLGGGVARPGITELESGSSLHAALARCGGCEEAPQALLIGGYFGSWVPFAQAVEAPLSNAGLAPLGAALGARSIAALPDTRCGIVETARIADYLARESAGQCGPCVFGLAALADAFESIAACDGSVDVALDRIPRLYAQIARRGACAHPDGTLGLVRSALDVFASEVEAHRSGRCSATSPASVLPA
jgi:NADH:ubiquinone oxidoreductase subunit F (NADH-binding)